MSIKQSSVGSALLAGIGFLTAAVFQVFSGLEYRAQEQAGLEPGYASEWIVIGTNIGLALLAVGLVALTLTGVVAIVRSVRGNPRKTPGQPA
jgi:hypothetical protein